MSASLFVAIGAGVAVLTGIGAGLGSVRQQFRSRRYRKDSRKQKVRFPKQLLLGCALAEATAIYGFVIALLIILFLK